MYKKTIGFKVKYWKARIPIYLYFLSIFLYKYLSLDAVDLIQQLEKEVTVVNETNIGLKVKSLKAHLYLIFLSIFLYKSYTSYVRALVNERR